MKRGNFITDYTQRTVLCSTCDVLTLAFVVLSKYAMFTYMSEEAVKQILNNTILMYLYQAATRNPSLWHAQIA